MLIQILISLFALFSLSRLFIKMRQSGSKLSASLLWFIFWLAVGIIVWIPSFTTTVANFLGIGRGADLVLYLGLIIVFYLIFKIYARLEKIEKNITTLVREITLKDKNQ
ncbi:MAG TPA: DUF2304 family protein [bacterium]|nr:DUF2304 family protein [bacterium]HPL95645.1 DUF2304 family protein [bacterium]